MTKNFEVVSLSKTGARSLMRELSEILSDAQVATFVQRFEVTLDEDGCPCAVVPEELCRVAAEDRVYLDSADVHIDTAMPGEDYGVGGDDR